MKSDRPDDSDLDLGVAVCHDERRGYWMSDEQKLAAIGRTVEEYGTCKKNLAALIAEADEKSRQLGSIARVLAGFHQANVATVEGFANSLNKDAASIPDSQTLRSLGQSIKTEMDRKFKLHQSLKDLGVEPKD